MGDIRSRRKKYLYDIQDIYLIILLYIFFFHFFLFVILYISSSLQFLFQTAGNGHLYIQQHLEFNKYSSLSSLAHFIKAKFQFD